MGRKSALRREIPLDSARIPRTSKLLICGLFQKGRVLAQDAVGYGDVFPITIGGRVFTFFVLFLGLGIVAVPTGLFRVGALEGARGGRRRAWATLSG